MTPDKRAFEALVSELERACAYGQGSVPEARAAVLQAYDASREGQQEPFGWHYTQRVPCGGGHWQYVETFSKKKPQNITDPTPLFTHPAPFA